MPKREAPQRGPREQSPPWLLGLGLVVGILLATWLLGGLFSGSWLDGLNRAASLISWVSAAITLAITLIAVLRWQAFLRWLRRGRVAEGFWEPVVQDVEALVTPIGTRGVEQAEWLLRHLRPKYVALLYSRDSRDQALALARRFENESGVSFVIGSSEIERLAYAVDDPLDAEACKRAATELLRQLRRFECPPERTFVDTTGGTKPMSLGAFQAAEEAGASTIYVAGRYSPTGRSDEGFITDPREREQGQVRFISNRTGQR